MKLKPSKSISLPPRLLIRLSESHLHRFLKLDPFPSNVKVNNKWYLIFHGPLNEWNYQGRLKSLQVNLLTSCERQLLWLHGQTLISPKLLRRDVTSILGTGLRILKWMNAEILANKINDMQKDPLRLWLTTLNKFRKYILWWRNLVN